MGKVLTVVGWLGLLIASIIFTLKALIELEGVEMSSAGQNALIAGVILSFVVGSGLMALVFYSARSGHDERADDPTNTLNKSQDSSVGENEKPEPQKTDLLIKILDKIFFWEKQ